MCTIFWAQLAFTLGRTLRRGKGGVELFSEMVCRAGKKKEDEDLRGDVHKVTRRHLHQRLDISWLRTYLGGRVSASVNFWKSMTRPSFSTTAADDPVLTAGALLLCYVAPTWRYVQYRRIRSTRCFVPWRRQFRWTWTVCWWLIEISWSRVVLLRLCLLLAGWAWGMLFLVLLLLWVFVWPTSLEVLRQKFGWFFGQQIFFAFTMGFCMQSPARFQS